MNDLSNYKIVEVNNFAADYDDVLTVASHLLGDDAIVTHLTAIFRSPGQSLDQTCGFIFHTADPQPDIEATELPSPGGVEILAGFLMSNLAGMVADQPPLVSSVKGWAFKVEEKGTRKSLFATAIYVLNESDNMRPS